MWHTHTEFALTLLTTGFLDLYLLLCGQVPPMTNRSFSGANSFLHCTPNMKQGRLFELDSLWPSSGKINRSCGSQFSQVSLMYSLPSNAWEGKAIKFLFEMASGELATVFRNRMDPGSLDFPLKDPACGPTYSYTFWVSEIKQESLDAQSIRFSHAWFTN